MFTLEKRQWVCSLSPRLLGTHPETGAPIKGRSGTVLGPYIVHDQGKEGKDYRSIKGERRCPDHFVGSGSRNAGPA